MPPMLPPLAERRPDLAVAAADLRLSVGPEAFSFTTTAELDAPSVLLGQTRAVEALELGLEMRAPGAHVFAAGYPGTGRGTAIDALLVHAGGSRARGDDVQSHVPKLPFQPARPEHEDAVDRRFVVGDVERRGPCR